MSEYQPLGFVKGCRWTAQQLHGRTVLKRVSEGTDPLTWDLPGKFSAQECEGGIVLSVVFSKDGKDSFMQVSQSEADRMVLNERGEFEVPLR